MLSDEQLRAGIAVLRRIESEIVSEYGPSDSRSEGACNSAHMWAAALLCREEAREIEDKLAEMTSGTGSSFYGPYARIIKLEDLISKARGEEEYYYSWVESCYPELHSRVMSEINN